MGKCASGQSAALALTSTLAHLLVVCTLLILRDTTSVTAEECGTKFTDPTSSTVLAQVVMQGTVRELNPVLGRAGRHSANVTVGRIYKGEDVLRRVSLSQDTVMVSEFGQENKDRCVASAEVVGTDATHIFFLRQTSDRGVLQMSAMPLPLETKLERRVRRSLCDTCVRPPRIKRLVCKNCAKEPRMKDMKPKKVKMGKRAKLRCIARGKPAPTFSWLKDGIPISSGSAGVSIRSTATSSTLIIRRTTRVHRGLYTCIAENEVGKSDKIAHLDVTERRPRPASDSERVSCERNPCLNGGSCYFSTISGLRTCVCANGFDGVRCELIRSENGSANTAESRQRDNNVVRGPVQTRSENSPNEVGRTIRHDNDSSGVITPDSHNRVNRQRTDPVQTSSDRQIASPPLRVPSQNRNQTDTAQDSKDNVATSNTQRSSSSARRLDTSTTSRSSTSTHPAGSSSVHTAEESQNVPDSEDTDEEDEAELSSYDPSELRSRLKKSRLKIVYCREKDYCKNGGRCRYVRKLNTKFCQCPTGFAGKLCEIVL